MRVQQFLKSFRQADDLEPGIFMKNDGTVWLRNPDGSETQLPGAAGSLPIWTDISSSLTVTNGTIGGPLTYAFALTQPADPDGSFPSLTAVWLRAVYATYTGGGEAGGLSMTLPNGSAAGDESSKPLTCEISGFWAKADASAFGGSWWASIDGNINVDGAPTFETGDILLCGMGTFPSF